VLVVCWSSKGGAGTTVVACAIAARLAAPPGPGCLLVDGAGDAPGVLGLPEPDSPGVAGLLPDLASLPAAARTAALQALEIPVGRGVSLITRGRGALGPGEAVEALAAALAGDERPVVVDAGVVDAERPDLLPLVAGASRSLLVTRACYLALRRATRLRCRPSGVVLVVEPGRALGAADVSQVLGVPVVAEVAVDPAVARVVDAGLLFSRLPRGLARSLVGAA